MAEFHLCSQPAKSQRLEKVALFQEFGSSLACVRKARAQQHADIADMARMLDNAQQARRRDVLRQQACVRIQQMRDISSRLPFRHSEAR